MRNAFSVEMRRYEIVCGFVWLVFYLFMMSGVAQFLLRLLGVQAGAATLNAVYFVLNFAVTAVIFRRFLAYSLPLAADHPLRFFCGMLLGFILHEGCQMALSLLYSYIAPDLWIPNNENIRSIASGSYGVMWAGAVLLAPLVEETLLRGLVFGSLRKKSRALAYAATAALFALMHIAGYIGQMDVPTLLLNLPLYILPSIALCASYEYAGTIWAPIGLHMLLNALSMRGIA